MNKLLKLIFYCLLLSAAPIAHIKFLKFSGGTHYIEPITSIKPFKIRNNYPTFILAHHTYIKWFIAGVYLKNKGYVLIDITKGTHIILPAEIIKELQAENVLPKEMPVYKASMTTNMKAYSLWLIMMMISFYFFVIRKPLPKLE